MVWRAGGAEEVEGGGTLSVRVLVWRALLAGKRHAGACAATGEGASVLCACARVVPWAGDGDSDLPVLAELDARLSVACCGMKACVKLSVCGFRDAVIPERLITAR